MNSAAVACSSRLPRDSVGGPIDLLLIALLMAGAVLVLADSAWTRRARAGVSGLWLGLASLAVVLDISSTSDLTTRLAATPPPPHFLAISAGLVILGIALVGVAALLTLRVSVAVHQRAGAILALVLVVICLAGLWPLWRSAPRIESPGAAGAIAVASAALAWFARRLGLGARIRAADRLLGAPRSSATGESSSPVGGRMVLLVVFVVALIPTVPTLMLGIIATAILLQHGARLRGQVGRFPLLPVFCLALLPASWLILTVTGSPVPPLWSLADAPFSPAAELWIVPWVLVAVWGLLALWPIHWLVPKPLAACLGGVLLVGVGIYGIPLGLQAFQAWIAPLIVLGLWWAVAIGRPELMLGALGLFGALAVPSRDAGLLLLIFVLASVLALPSGWLRIPSDIRLKGGLVMAAGGIWISLLAGLQSQVVYTVLCVAAVAAASLTTTAPIAES